MNKNLKRILPILLGIVIICSLIWYLFVYDRDFTRDILLESARYFEDRGDHAVAAWLYDRAYLQSSGDETVAIELAEHFKENGNYTQAEVTLSQAIAEGGGVELYIALCRTYVEQDKLLDAVTMLEHITDESIRTQIEALRPAAPTADPAPDYYRQYMTVTVTCDGKLYLTEDQQYPSTALGPHDGTVELSGGENTLYALAVAENGLVSPLAIFGYTISGVIEEVTIADGKLDAAIRNALDFDPGRTLYSSDLWTVTELVLPEGADSYLELYRLPYLQSLTIEQSSADSLEGLSSLTGLTELTVRNAALRTSDLLTVASLPNLQKLTLTDCGLSGIDNLAGARNLTHLNLSNNSIRDFTSLSFLDNLVSLDLSHNALTTLNAVSGLSSLEQLNVSYNSLTSVGPVSVCTGLRSLDISGNFITSLDGLHTLTGLTRLMAAENSIVSVAPLAGLAKLTELDVSSNQIPDLSQLSGLAALEFFYFSKNQVSALPAFGKDCALITVDGSDNSISSLSALKDCQQLNYVLMDNNNISSVDPLSGCHNLIKVSVYNNPVRDVSALTDQNIIVNYNPIG